MKKTFNIEVDCANCASLVEEAIKKLDGITDVTVNFMTQKMTLDFADGADEKALIKAIKKTAKKIEPDFEIEL